MKKHIIFLDIDGVLNNPEDCEGIFGGLGGPPPYPSNPNPLTIEDWNTEPDDWEINKERIAWSERNVKAFKRLEKTKADVVISSTWRLGGIEPKHFQEMFKLYNINLKVVGLTPIIGMDRDKEVNWWLENNDVDNYVIIDDDDKFSHRHIKNKVIVNFKVGLTDCEADMALNILERV